LKKDIKVSDEPFISLHHTNFETPHHHHSIKIMADNATNSGKRKRQNSNNKRNKKRRKTKAVATSNKPRRNWIETCTESINRIPAGCAAPLTCVVTRCELEEEALLPSVICNEQSIVEQCSKSHEAQVTSNGESQDDDRVDEPKKQPSELNASESLSNSTVPDESIRIATAKTLDQAALDELLDKPWRISNTIQINGEEKNLFIPVKRDASAVGPTQVSYIHYMCSFILNLQPSRLVSTLSLHQWQMKQKKNKRSHNHKHQQRYHHLPNGDNGDGITNPHPKDIVPDKFWAQRKRLFSKFDEGIQIGDDETEMWYSVTPEAIANHVAERMVQMVKECRELSGENARTGDVVILDAFCGCGGNMIAFARKNVKVIAVDNDLHRLKMAANNARVYGIDESNVEFVHADVVDVLRSYSKGSKNSHATNDQGVSTEKAQTYSGYRIGGLELLSDTIDAIFLSPPWGGMGYDADDSYDLIRSVLIESEVKGQGVQQTLLTNGGELLNISAKALFSDATNDGVVSYFLPRNIDGIAVGQIAVASGIENECFELEQNVVNGKVKTVTAYFGHCVREK
jgi:trimethylguanosine synthase